jgi:hypothetical protein
LLVAKAAVLHLVAQVVAVVQEQQVVKVLAQEVLALNAVVLVVTVLQLVLQEHLLPEVVAVVVLASVQQW